MNGAGQTPAVTWLWFALGSGREVSDWQLSTVGRIFTAVHVFDLLVCWVAISFKKRLKVRREVHLIEIIKATLISVETRIIHWNFIQRN